MSLGTSSNVTSSLPLSEGIALSASLLSVTSCRLPQSQLYGRLITRNRVSLLYTFTMELVAVDVAIEILR